MVTMSKGSKKRERETLFERVDESTTVEIQHEDMFKQLPKEVQAIGAIESDKEIDDTMRSIETLKEVGIASADVKKLAEEGFRTVESVVYAPKKKIYTINGLSQQKADHIIKTCRDFLPMGFNTCSDWFRARRKVLRLTTGSNEIDRLLGGGFESGALTEIFGAFRTGKTQLCHTLSVTTQLPFEDGGLNGKVLYIDTQNSFRPERFVSIARRFNLDPYRVLHNIACARAFSTDHLLDLTTQLERLLTDPDQEFGLVVVDSATSLYRTDYQGRSELAPRQIHLAKFLRGLQNIAEEFGVVVALTNQVMANVDTSAQMFQLSEKPVGGHIMAHASTTRLSLRKGKGEQRIMKVCSSPCLPESESIFGIYEGGIEDVREDQQME